MKVILCSFNNEVKIKSVLRLQDRGVKIIYWLGQKKIFDKYASRKDKFPNTIFHNTIDAVRAIPADGVSEKFFETPSLAFIKEMQQCQIDTLSMMNAVDFHNTVLDKKNRLYYEYLKYWNGVLVSTMPDAVIFGDVPHVPHNYVIFCLAKKLGIKTVISTDVKRLPNRMIFLKDFTKYEEIKIAYGKIQLSGGARLDDLSQELEEYYLKEIDKSVDSTPVVAEKSFLNKQKRSGVVIPDLQTILKNIKNFSLFESTRRYLKELRKKKILASLEPVNLSTFSLKIKIGKWNKINQEYKKEYLTLQAKVDFDKNYVYVPLHSQPERSTTPEGGIFTDQILMIDMLSKTLPEDWIIYVKEHPSQWIMYRGFIGRYLGYYQAIAKLKNVFLAPVETSTFELIENSQAVASVTGTASWEAVLRGIPTLLFGFTFFMHCHGVFRASSLEECKQAFEKIANGFKPDKQQVINFLKAVDDVCVKAQDHHGYNKYSEMSEEENINNFSNGYYKILVS